MSSRRRRQEDPGSGGGGIERWKLWARGVIFCSFRCWWSGRKEREDWKFQNSVFLPSPSLSSLCHRLLSSTPRGNVQNLHAPVSFFYFSKARYSDPQNTATGRGTNERPTELTISFPPFLLSLRSAEIPYHARLTFLLSLSLSVGYGGLRSFQETSCSFGRGFQRDHPFGGKEVKLTKELVWPGRRVSSPPSSRGSEGMLK